MSEDSLAVVDLDRCKPHRCNYECANYCPPNRAGKPCITLRREADEPERLAGKPEQVRISEEICLGEKCGICVHKCPFDAIKIINLPSELDENPIHRYGENAFKLYGLPALKSGKVTGILGPNGIGKTTALRILSGDITPNLGYHEEEPDINEVKENFRGTVIQGHLERLKDGEISVAEKPQSIDKIPEKFHGRVGELLSGIDEREVMDELLTRLSVQDIKDQPIDTLSGGELQRTAMVAALSREADLYFLDEVTPYLDISQRVAAARLFKEFSEEGKSVIVVEHDLAILDMIADHIHIVYGEPGVYGVFTGPKSTKRGINEYLDGYLENENIRMRSESIRFSKRSPQEFISDKIVISYPGMTKSYSQGGFSLDVHNGDIYRNEVLGIVGPNGIGKTTFAKLLAGRLGSDDGGIDLEVAYKPQYIDLEGAITVKDFLESSIEKFGTSYWESEIAEPLKLDQIMEQELNELSGGEQQRVAIAVCLSKEADLHLFDEPSAHLDVEQRVLAVRTIRRHSENKKIPALVIDHDIYLIDLIADRLQVFSGIPGEHGHAGQPLSMREGMNEFLKDLDITFRRDPDTGRPRINKPGSRKDREQKKIGEYYYVS
ncbi:MAG: ribosome biogenesis/translation initiation ATPase RLI [Candidatus Saliniplasma sp.]